MADQIIHTELKNVTHGIGWKVMGTLKKVVINAHQIITSQTLGIEWKIFLFSWKNPSLKSGKTSYSSVLFIQKMAY